jgi:hypothetical protein
VSMVWIDTDTKGTASRCWKRHQYGADFRHQYFEYNSYNVFQATDTTAVATSTHCVRRTNLNADHPVTYFGAQVFESRPRATPEAPSFVRCMCSLESEVQQGPSNLPKMLCERLTMYLRRLKEARQARAHTQEEPRRHTVHQRIKAATITRWQRVWQVQGKA